MDIHEGFSIGLKLTFCSFLFPSTKVFKVGSESASNFIFDNISLPIIRKITVIYYSL